MSDVAPSVFMFCAVRRVDGREALTCGRLYGLPLDAEEAAAARDAEDPAWAARNPVVRIACVLVEELPVAAAPPGDSRGDELLRRWAGF